MRYDSHCRIYGQFFGVTPEQFQSYGTPLPYETVSFLGGATDIEHEGRLIDVTPLVDAAVALLPENREGHLDVIDHREWTITRYFIKNKKVEKETFDLDNILEHTKNDGNW